MLYKGTVKFNGKVKDWDLSKTSQNEALMLLCFEAGVAQVSFAQNTSEHHLGHASALCRIGDQTWIGSYGQNQFRVHYLLKNATQVKLELSGSRELSSDLVSLVFHGRKAKKNWVLGDSEGNVLLVNEKAELLNQKKISEHPVTDLKIFGQSVLFATKNKVGILDLDSFEPVHCGHLYKEVVSIALGNREPMVYILLTSGEVLLFSVQNQECLASARFRNYYPGSRLEVAGSNLLSLESGILGSLDTYSSESRIEYYTLNDLVSADSFRVANRIAGNSFIAVLLQNEVQTFEILSTQNLSEAVGLDMNYIRVLGLLLGGGVFLYLRKAKQSTETSKERENKVPDLKKQLYDLEEKLQSAGKKSTNKKKVRFDDNPHYRTFEKD